MSKLAFLFLILLTAIVVVTLHFTALKYFLYWVLPWFDLLVHFLAGFLVALMGVWFFVYVARMRTRVCLSSRSILYTVLLSVFVIGIGWEVFEYLEGLRAAQDYAVDTATDLIMDFFGGFLAYRVILFFNMCPKSQDAS